MKFDTTLSHAIYLTNLKKSEQIPEQTYKDVLLLAGITKLETRCEDLCLKSLTKITRGGLLTQHVTRSNEHNYFIRSLNKLSTYKCRTDWFKNSFFPNTINIANSQ